MARVVVTVTARDLTGPQLARMRRNFNNLGVDMDRALGERTRGNFNRLRTSINQTGNDLRRLRGSIPEADFDRLNEAIRRASAQMNRGFSRTSATQLAQVADQVRRVREGFTDLDRAGRIRITPDVNRNRFRQRLTSALTSPVRTVGRLLGGTLSDGLAQGVSNAFRGIGPAMGAILAVAIVAALAVVGAALSGLLVTVLGAAFVGIGVASAFQAKEVQKNWKATVESIKKDFKGVGDALIPVVQHAIDRLGRLSDSFAPVLKRSLGETKTATDKFIQSILDGFESFGKASFQPIMDAWNLFAPVFGEEWDEFMDELGNSFGRMADLVREHPTEIANALDIVFEALDLLVDTVTFLGEAWVFMSQTAGDALGFVLQGVRYLAIAVSETLFAILDGATQAFGWVPGLGGQLKDARRNFGEFKDDVAAKLESMSEDAFSWDDALNKANRKRTLEANISTWNNQIEAAKKKLESVPKSKQAKVKADIADLRDKVQRAKDELASIRNKFVTVSVTTYYYAVESGQVSGRTSKQMGRKVGGNIGAAATGGVRSNMTLVGEAGPELVNLAPGSHVKSNPDSRRMVAGAGGGGGVPMQVNVMIDGKVAARALVDPLRGEIRDRGGNVQDALGQRGRGN